MIYVVLVCVGDISPENQAILGLKFVNMLTEQLNGTVVIDCSRGTRFTFMFSKGAEKTQIY